jgi:fructoselysine 6-phosphate deglycase
MISTRTEDAMTDTTLPLRPREVDLVPVLRHATSQRGLCQEIAAEALRRGVTRVVFTGVGGSWASSVPVNVLLGSTTSAFSSENLNATELTDLYLGCFGDKTLVVAASHSGGTPETVVAAQRTAERGALVVSVSSETGNPLSDAAAFNLTYGSDRTITSAKYLLLTELAHALFEAYGVEARTEEVRAALDVIPEATEAALVGAEPFLAATADRYADADNIYVLASGPLTGLAYMLSVCYLVEQQWMKSTHFLAADFFHGPFELAQKTQPYILLSGEDGTRPQMERVTRFLDTYHDDYANIDVADMALEGVAESVRGDVGHIPLAAVVARLADHIEARSGHDLDTRLYMHRVDY